MMKKDRINSSKLDYRGVFPRNDVKYLKAMKVIERREIPVTKLKSLGDSIHLALDGITEELYTYFKTEESNIGQPSEMLNELFMIRYQLVKHYHQLPREKAELYYRKVGLVDSLFKDYLERVRLEYLRREMRIKEPKHT